jgi:Tfp pilus assembly protein PilO
MNKTLEMVKSLDTKYVYMLVAGLLLVLAVADYFLIASPQISGIISIDKKISQLGKDAETLVTNKQRLNQFQAQLEIARRDVKNFNSMVYTKDEIPVILKTIFSLASENGVIIDQLVPQPVDAKPLVANEEGNFYGMGIFVRTHAGYHQFGKFMNQLELKRMFWRISSAQLAVDEKDTQKHPFNMTLKVLILEK